MDADKHTERPLLSRFCHSEKSIPLDSKDMRNYYKILEIDESANAERIQSAYRRLAKLYHPDINPNYKLAADIFKQINEAYSTLANPKKKKEYDQLLRQFQAEKQRHRSRTDDSGTDTGADVKKKSSPHDFVWDPSDDFLFVHDDSFSRDGGGCYETDTKKRWATFLTIVYSLDVCLVGYFAYSMSAIEHSSVPNIDIHGPGKSLLVDYSSLLFLQKLSIGLSLIILLMPLNKKFNITYSIVNHFTKRGTDLLEILLTINFAMKSTLSFSCITFYFAMELFELHSSIFIYSFVWHSFVCASLFVLYLDFNASGG